MRSLLFATLLLSTVMGCTPADETAVSDSSPAPAIAEIAKNYKNLQSMTKQPVFVNPVLAMLCRGASQSDVEAAAKLPGPHANTRVAIYMNELAADAFRHSFAAYPVGSVIVKEKKGQGYRNDGPGPKSSKTPDGVGGMIKRSPGFDPAHGDWEYFYFVDPAKIESGTISSCVQCHAGTTATDHVFATWAKGE